MKVAGETDFRRSLGRARARRQTAGLLHHQQRQLHLTFPCACVLSPASHLREKKKQTLAAKKKKPLCSRSGQAARNNSKGVLKNNRSPVCSPACGPGQLLRRSEPAKPRAKGCRKHRGGAKAQHPPTPRAPSPPTATCSPQQA